MILLPPQATRQLDRQQLTASRFLPGKGAGLRSSLRRRAGPDFREHRSYVPGDELRFVDWNASARQEQVFVKQEEYPREISAYVLLDCSGSMRWGEPAKSTAALSLAAALGYLALSHGDRLVVFPYADHHKQPFGPLTGKGQIPALLKYLGDLRFEGGSNIQEAVSSFTQRVTKGGLTLIISDFLGVDDLATTLAALPSPSWDVILFHVLHPEELIPTYMGNDELVDIETGKALNYDINEEANQEYVRRMEAWRSSLDLTAVDHNAFYTLIPADWSLAEEIIPSLRKNHVLTPTTQ